LHKSPIDLTVYFVFQKIGHPLGSKAENMP